ncbi:hypothetical protein DXT99_15975 [Pontibacter diazotrophicus]|uniref:7(1) septoil knot domain-containing protein n=1 Tax=Pontibacter diazotrophicus TaxID=1400979 RepID=A0A3D8L9S7_9BACT|nr:DUF6150 family protein [Pontibacter diazotrophicus]RDV14066.1 hypothetical protein DXT99_15975 [Pontibacter diazotrophicus]
MRIYFIFWMALLPLFNSPATAPAPAREAIVERDYCDIYGAVYLERDPRYKNDASKIVYLNEEEAFANLVVYRENNKLFADGTGIWFITPSKAFANHILYVTEQRHQADFTVYFTDMRSSATCRD